MNKAKGSKRIYPKRKRGNVEKGVQIFLLAATRYITSTQNGEYKTHKKVK